MVEFIVPSKDFLQEEAEVAEFVDQTLSLLPLLPPVNQSAEKLACSVLVAALGRAGLTDNIGLLTKTVLIRAYSRDLRAKTTWARTARRLEGVSHSSCRYDLSLASAKKSTLLTACTMTANSTTPRQ